MFFPPHMMFNQGKSEADIWVGGDQNVNKVIGEDSVYI